MFRRNKSASASASSSSSPASTSVRPNDETPVGDPPSYTRNPPLPSEPVSYSFIPASLHAMVLVPTGANPSTVEPVYYVSHSPDMWNPFLMHYSVHRGGSSTGERVGGFELGIARRKARVTIGVHEEILNNVLRQGAFWGSIYFQFRKEPKLTWVSLKGGRLECKSSSNNPVKLADFVHVGRVANLMIYPDGQELFDLIMISVLILEHIKQLPDRKSIRKNATIGSDDLFNWDLDLQTDIT